jgi:hypothetical protein
MQHSAVKSVVTVGSTAAKITYALPPERPIEAIYFRSEGLQKFSTNFAGLLRRVQLLSCHPKSPIVRLLATLSNHLLTIVRNFFPARSGSQKIFGKCRARIAKVHKNLFSHRMLRVEKMFARLRAMKNSRHFLRSCETSLKILGNFPQKNTAAVPRLKSGRSIH